MTTEPSLNILELIYNLVERLITSTDFDAEQIELFLNSVRDNFDQIAAHYNQPAPEGAEGVRELMLESLSLFDQSLEEITEFLHDDDEDRLRKAVDLSEQANDLLAAVEEVIQQNKLVLAEMVQA